MSAFVGVQTFYRFLTVTLEHVLKAVHQNRILGQAPGIIEEFETTIELVMIQIEELWQHLGLHP